MSQLLVCLFCFSACLFVCLFFFFCSFSLLLLLFFYSHVWWKHSLFEAYMYTVNRRFLFLTFSTLYKAKGFTKLNMYSYKTTVQVLYKVHVDTKSYHLIIINGKKNPPIVRYLQIRELLLDLWPFLPILFNLFFKSLFPKLQTHVVLNRHYFSEK